MKVTSSWALAARTHTQAWTWTATATANELMKRGWTKNWLFIHDRDELCWNTFLTPLMNNSELYSENKCLIMIVAGASHVNVLTKGSRWAFTQAALTLIVSCHASQVPLCSLSVVLLTPPRCSSETICSFSSAWRVKLEAEVHLMQATLCSAATGANVRVNLCTLSIEAHLSSCIGAGSGAVYCLPECERHNEEETATFWTALESRVNKISIINNQSPLYVAGLRKSNAKCQKCDEQRPKQCSEETLIHLVTWRLMIK